MNKVRESEKRWVFALLMLIGGMYGAFTYSVRGGVFCNAQTANLVMMAMSLGKGMWKHALYYFIPMSAYLSGAAISELLEKPMARMHIIRWETLLVLIEMLAVVILGLIPDSAPFQITQISVNFICAMQYTTFRKTDGIASATTFCTNHVRQTGVALIRIFRGDKQARKRLAHHTLMLVMFVIGGMVSTALCMAASGRAIWAALVPLGVVFAALLRDDLKKNK